MAYKITGRVLKVSAPQSFNTKNGSTLTKRDVVIKAIRFDQYTGQPTEDDLNTPKFSFFGEKTTLLDNIFPGDTVTVHFDISGRAYEKNGVTDYITDVRPFRIEKNGSQANNGFSSYSSGFPQQNPNPQENMIPNGSQAASPWGYDDPFNK